MHHKQSNTYRENVCLGAIIFRVHGKSSQVAIDFRIFKNTRVVVRFEFHLNFLQIDFIVPNFRGIVKLGANFNVLFDYGIIFLLKNFITFYFFHPSSKTKVGDNEPAFLVHKQIFRFNIAMDDAMRMQIINTFYKLLEDVPGGIFIEPI